MLASANIFDALGEVDTKFARIIEKEYESISNEIRKWFKRLAVSVRCTRLSETTVDLHPSSTHKQKEEKAHDDLAASANAKMKQAGRTHAYILNYSLY